MPLPSVFQAGRANRLSARVIPTIIAFLAGLGARRAEDAMSGANGIAQGEKNLSCRI